MGVDPIAPGSGGNGYSFVSGRPLTQVDPVGAQGQKKDWDDMTPQEAVMENHRQMGIHLRNAEIAANLGVPKIRVDDDLQVSLAEKTFVGGVGATVIGLAIIFSGPPGWIAGLAGA